MRARTGITLAVIGCIVAVLGVARSWGDPSAKEPARDASTVDRPVILDFGRGQCVACKRMMPVLEAVQEAWRGVVDVRYLDLSVPANQARADELGVRLIPTQIFLAADGRELFRHEGFLPLDEIELKLEELGWIPPH